MIVMSRVGDDLSRKLKALGIGRFQAMALLQAARYYILHGDLDKAKSFGLNRAVFYAWAKYYGSRYPRRLSRVEEELRKNLLKGVKPSKCPEGYTEVLGECVQVSQRGYYMMGDVEQTPYDYDQQVTYKIKRLIDPGKAWKMALEYVSRFPEWVLKDPIKFYKYVYEPIRDTFFEKLLREGRVEPPREVIEKLTALDEMVKKARRSQRNILDFMGGDRESSSE
jgi:hypothetical protein